MTPLAIELLHRKIQAEIPASLARMCTSCRTPHLQTGGKTVQILGSWRRAWICRICVEAK